VERGKKSEFRYITHKGKQILHVDHSAIENLPDVEQSREFFARARREIDAQPLGSIRLLTSVSPKMWFNLDIINLQKEFAQANNPYIMKSAVVGATAASKAIIATLRFFTGREIRAFETVAEALDWLAE
jgi:hypothetical protein